jgi:bifunctional UDP-N-acetylglucosamine pyrophosphorylase / glucosamine-1-phosphate N-acetyltransferase
MSGKVGEIFAVIPAAGRGTRLHSDLPKLLTPISTGVTIWTLLSRRLLKVVDHINVIVSPDGEPLIRRAVAHSNLADRVSLSLQPEPLGMGDAIFRGFPVWSHAHTILIVWGDQVFVSERTMRAACSLHSGNACSVVLPLVSLPAPYVEYIFADDGALISVRQSREGERCTPGGFADVGTFVLSVARLQNAWTSYLAFESSGALTGEINFLPFLPFLSLSGWNVRRLLVTDAREARGINTPEDLAYLRSATAAK